MIFVGKAGSGKDTIADLIGWRKISFATPLKRAVSICQNESVDSAMKYLAGINETSVDVLDCVQLRDALKEVYKTYEEGKQRGNLQLLGQVARNQDKDFWASICRKHVESIRKYHGDDYVITDCRFNNEFDKFPDEFSVFIECDMETRINRLKSRDGNVDLERLVDVSETELDDLKHRCTYIVRTDDVLFNDMFMVADEIIQAYNEWWFMKHGAVV